MLKSFFTKVSVLFILALLPFSLLANTEIIGESVSYEVVNTVIKNFKKKGVKGFTNSKIDLKSFALPTDPNSEKSIELGPLKLVIDDVIVFRTETSSVTELLAYQSSAVPTKSIRFSKVSTPG